MDDLLILYQYATMQRRAAVEAILTYRTMIRYERARRVLLPARELIESADAVTQLKALKRQSWRTAQRWKAYIATLEESPEWNA